MRTAEVTPALTAVLLLALSSATAAAAPDEDGEPMTATTRPCLAIVGTYTDGGSKGIYIFEMDTAGALSLRSTVGGIVNPSFLAAGPWGHCVYAVQETGDTGAVFAYELDRRTASLRLINQQPSHGTSPCHLAVDRTGRVVVVANYGSGSVCALPIGDDGALGPATAVIRHEGSSVNPQRQEGPHAHSVTIDPDNRFVIAADLGLDKLMVYELDADAGTLVANDVPYAQVAPGAGPRHFAFHPSGRLGYVVDELNNTVTGFTYDQSRGVLSEIETVPTLPRGWDGTSYCADIHVSPSGEFLYASNRGHDSIVVYRIDQDTGRLSYVEHELTGGKTPRNFAIDPSGRFLLAANQQTDTIVTFRIEPATGELEPTGHVASVPAPVCVLFAPDGR